jgi:hypothetical protein
MIETNLFRNLKEDLDLAIRLNKVSLDYDEKLAEIDSELDEINNLKYREKISQEEASRRYKLLNEQGKGWDAHSKLYASREPTLEHAKVIYTRLTDNVLDELKTFLDLDLECDKAEVVVVDYTQYKRFLYLAGVEMEAERPVPNSFFRPHGTRDFNHSTFGPVISYFLPTLEDGGLPTIVEESTHFLQWIAEKAEEKKKLSTEEKYSQDMIYEATAETIRRLAGFESNVVLPAERDQDVTYPLMAKTLLAWGRERCYDKILQAFYISSIDNLSGSRPFSAALRVFPTDLFHYLGYSLGEGIAEAIKTPKDVKDFSKLAFSPTDNYSSKLDDLINLRKEIVRRNL